jgi:hypothetical protein
MVSNGQQISVKVTVTRVQGDNVDFDMDWSLDRNVLAEEVRNQAKNAGRNVDSVTCPGDLKAAVGTTVHCDFTESGRSYDATVTVTDVQGAMVHYDIAFGDQPK